MDDSRLRRNTKSIKYVILLAIILALIGVGLYRYNRPFPALTVTQTKPTGQATSTTSVDLPFPNSGEGALATSTGFSLGQGTNGSKVSSTASIAKLITVLTVLQKHPLSAGQAGPTLTINADDVAIYAKYYNEDGSNVEVQQGEQLSEYQMIEAMLLPSGNNIADSLAIWAFGSLSSYKTAAQQYVKSIGMNDTTIGSDASGFAPDTTSTAADLVKLGQAATKQSVITEIAAKPTVTLPVVGAVANTNTALGKDDINGLKTGTSDQAGNCLVFTATHTFGESQKVTFVGSVLGAVSEESRFSVAQQLLETAYANYTQVTIAKTGDSLGTIKSAWGETATITPANDLTAYTWLGGTDGTTQTITLKNATSVANDQTVGTLAIDGESVPLVTSKAISQPSFLWRIFH